MLKGYRTYLSIAAVVLVTLAGIVETGGVAVLSPEVTAATVVVLSAIAAFFRRQA